MEIYLMRKDPVKIQMGDEIRRLREEDPEELAKMLSNLTEEQATEIMYDWNIMGRPEQIIDWEEHEEMIWLALAGRGK